MNETTTIVRFRQPDTIDDPLTDVLRTGARKLLAQAIEIEAEAYLASTRDLKLPDGRERLVRHGHGPERAIQTGIGPVEVSRVKIRDRGASGEDRIRFTSAILPKWARRMKSLNALLPILYLRGLSTGDFQEALAALLGQDAPNLSPSATTRLTGEWQAEYERWQARDLSARRYVYVWADGVYLQARIEDQAECILVLIGATPEGKKELVGFQAGVRKSAQSWRELLVEITRRGLSVPPRIAVGDGALGFWKALDELFPGTHHQRCWLHKTVNVLNKVPKSVQPGMKVAPREIYLAPTRAQAEVAIDLFADAYSARGTIALTLAVWRNAASRGVALLSLFKRRRFPVPIILLCVRWYCKYGISYRDLAEMMQERGVAVDPSTIFRWVQRYAPEIEKRIRPYQGPRSGSWRVDETYVRVGGK
jgi:putative transposase